MALRSNNKSIDSFAIQNEIQTQFWGICCESGKQYSQVVKQRFHITMAVLDPKSYDKDNETIVSLMVLRGECEYLLCILKHGEIYQVNLNLVFDKGEEVIFYVNGQGKVYLSGYQVTDPEVLNDENGSVVLPKELSVSKKKSTPKKKSPLKSETKDASAKSGKKRSVRKGDCLEEITENAYSVIINGEISDDDDDEEDKDFSADDEETDSEEVESDESDLEEEVKKLAEDQEEEDGDSEENSEEHELVDLSASQKRKRRQLQEQHAAKRSKKDKIMSNINTAVENSDDVCCEDNGSEESSDSDQKEDTPIQRKSPVASSAEKKKSRKKKKKNRLSVAGTSDQTTRSPNSSSSGNKSAFTTLKGGVQVKDLIDGRGPVAKNGKIVHIFYVGKLENGTIFNSVLPGKNNPLSFQLGKGAVLKGLDIGLEGMKVGGKRKLIIPANLGYGSAQMQDVPPNSKLHFLVELQAVS